MFQERDENCSLLFFSLIIHIYSFCGTGVPSKLPEAILSAFHNISPAQMSLPPYSNFPVDFILLLTARKQWRDSVYIGPSLASLQQLFNDCLVQESDDAENHWQCPVIVDFTFLDMPNVVYARYKFVLGELQTIAIHFIF